MSTSTDHEKKKFNAKKNKERIHSNPKCIRKNELI